MPEYRRDMILARKDPPNKNASLAITTSATLTKFTYIKRRQYADEI